MTLPQPVKPLPILFDIQDAPRWVPQDYITEDGVWLNMGFIPVPSVYRSLIIGPDGTSLRTLGRCTSTIIELKPYNNHLIIVIYGLEGVNTRLAFNKLVKLVDTIRNKVETDNENGLISSYCINQ